jgi:hypothetical protein
MDTFATPETPRRRGLMTQRARTEVSIGDSLVGESPIIMTRLSEERG